MLNNIIGALAITLVNLYIWSKILQNKLRLKDYRVYVGGIILTGLIIANYFFNIKIVSLFFVIVFYIFTLMYVFRIDLKRAASLAMITELVYIFAETVMIIAVVILLNINNQGELIDIFFGTIYANLLITLLVLLIFKLKVVNKLYCIIFDLLKKEKNTKVFNIVSIVILSYSVIFSLFYYSNNLLVFMIVFSLMTLLYIIIFLRFLIIKNNYLKIHVKYNDTLETLKSYEEIMDKFKVSNHENKNQLLTIKNMLNKTQNGEVLKFIEKLVDDKYKDDEDLIMETSKIPSGGLRALIYSKLLYMKNNNIDFMLKADRKIRSIQLNDSHDNLILDICKIIGVFLDNAIEATQNIENGKVSIELYLNKDVLNISISNIFEGVLELEKIEEKRYTTKGSEHGYGLSLAKEIINNNPKLKNIKMVNDNVFTQILKIEI